ncbi:S9 family peptidase [Branchiibius sp. NY16-3462-2]|uniref:S9 family peptidase n=1 Tax=Branchiibius sp. NY16-3462-2 TaxID=1807500 RepID=UPI000799D7DE|nr:S9 family peptidase [Branchiibius sp. NY16-3462-2]KYH43976.1 protease 2 [Branchiibius sp. NY16-3462-2]
MSYPVLPPFAARRDRIREHHGDRFVDPWAWFDQRDDPEVLAHIDAENQYTAARTAHLASAQETLFAELKSHIRETDVSVPVRADNYWYYSRTRQGEQYEIHCRSPYVEGSGRPDPEGEVPGEQVLLDVNAEAAAHDFYEVGGLEVSADEQVLAILADTTGDERYDLQVRRISDGTVLDDSVRGAVYGLAWSRDGRYLFYTRCDEAWRTHQVWRHEIGKPTDTDQLVLQEDDKAFDLGIETSRDEQWLLIGAGSKTTTEFRLLDLNSPLAEPTLIEPRSQGVEYVPEVDDDRVLIVHNLDRADFDLAVAPLAEPGRDNWQPVLRGTGTERIAAAHAFASVVAVSMRRDGLPAVRVLPKVGDGFGAPIDLPVDSELTSVRVGSNPMYDAGALQVSATSFLQPRTISDFDPATGALEILRQRPVPHFDSSQYAEQRLWVTARDGASVPVSILHRRDLRPDGSNPGYLYGYGAYEHPTDPAVRVSWLPLLERGVVVAVAHVRGGGELGRAWYEGGRLLAKKNSFTDFVDAGHALIDQGWVAPDRLVAEGGSAGGLLIGAAVNEDPALFRAVIAAVPFVDALTTILDPSMPLTTGEWEEWGNPLADPEVYAYMKSYTPYENITATTYPSILATTSLHDTRVFFTEPAKWVQQLRATVTSDSQTRPVLLKTETAAGHGGQSGRYDALRDVAFELAFLLDQLGLVD